MSDPHPFEDKEAVWLTLALISDDLGLDITKDGAIYPAAPERIYEAFKTALLNASKMEEYANKLRDDCINWRQRADERAAEIVRLRNAATTFVDKLEAVQADGKYQSVWQVSQLHVGPYTGPQYAAELRNLKDALCPVPGCVNGWIRPTRPSVLSISQPCTWPGHKIPPPE